MTVIIATGSGTVPVRGLADILTPLDDPVSVLHSRVMEVDSPHAPEVSATLVTTLAQQEPDVWLREVAISDDEMLTWGRALPREPGIADMLDLDI